MKRVTNRRLADENHEVVTVVGDGGYRRIPCRGCPWRVANAGEFPAEAFRLSADTAYDGAFNQFACHESGAEKAATCAGFLLRNSANNVGARIKAIKGEIDYSALVEPAEALFGSYREMAIGNGVAPDDPVLARCRADDE